MIIILVEFGQCLECGAQQDSSNNNTYDKLIMELANILGYESKCTCMYLCFKATQLSKYK